MKIKKVNILAFVIAFTSLAMPHASASEIFSRHNPDPWVKGFSYGVPDAICYRGNAEGVCSALKYYDAKMRKEYQEGEHEYLELSSCKLRGKVALVGYIYRNDYEPQNEKYNYYIGKCQ